MSVAEDLAAVRARTLALVEPLSTEDLERQIDPLMSPLVWDLAHIAAYEDLWLVHRLGGRELLHGELAAVYDAFETPRSVRGEIELLDHDGALAYLGQVRERTLEVLDERGPDPVLHELVLRHELQHTETMLQAMRLGGLAVPELDGPPRMTAPDGWVDVPAGELLMGAENGGFAYDNELPRHARQVDAFRISRRPVSVAELDRRRRCGHAGGARLLGRGGRLRPGAARRTPAHRGRVGARGPARPARRHRPRLGVDRPPSSPATRASSRTPTASTPRSSSTRATASSAAAPGPRIRASPAPRSATGTSLSGGRSSRA